MVAHQSNTILKEPDASLNESSGMWTVSKQTTAPGLRRIVLLRRGVLGPVSQGQHVRYGPLASGSNNNLNRFESRYKNSLVESLDALWISITILICDLPSLNLLPHLFHRIKMKGILVIHITPN